MKKITILCALVLLSGMSFAQNAPIDFETGGNGATWTWTTFENGTDPVAEIIANPDMTGANTSATVMKFTALQAGNPWAGCESKRGTTDLGKFSWDANNRTVKIMVWKPVISDVGIKFIADSGWAEIEVKVANTKINEWEELTFDFSGKINPPASQGMLSQIAIFPDFQARGGDNICYVDNVTFGAKPSTVSNLKAPINFEPTGEGAAPWTWEVSENSTNPALEFITNPSKVAPNTSDNVAKFTALMAGNPWALCFTDSIGTFTFDATNSIVKIMVWKTSVSDVAIKFEIPNGINKELKVANTKTSEWEELTFDFSSEIGKTFSRMVIIPDFVGAPRAADQILYFDEITFTNGVTVAEPMAAAPDPTYPMDSVISLFSNVYTDVPVSSWLTGWSSSSLADIQVAGNDVKKYSGMDVVGIETTGANTIDATNMEHLNFDMWTPNSTKLKLKLVDFGADGAFQGGDDSEFELSFDAPALDSWVNYHIPLTDFTGLSARAHIAQIIFVSEPAGTSINYLDNFFFSKETTSSIITKNAFSKLSIYPNPASASINLNIASSSLNILDYSIVNLNGKTIQSEQVNSNALNKTINTSNFNAGIYFVKINTNQGSYTHKIIVQ